MILGGKCVFIASNVRVKDGKTYASCSLENNDSVLEINVDEQLVPALPTLKKYQEHTCVFEYDKVNTAKGNFTVFKLVDIQPVKA